MTKLLGDRDGSVRVLIVFQHCGKGTAYCQSRTVEGMDKHRLVRFRISRADIRAAGIFQSNLGNETQARNHGNASREAFEQALGCPVLDEFQLYQEAEERSKRRCGLL